jgi:hypothetical protein
VGPLLGCVELHDDPDSGGEAGISRRGERLLFVRLLSFLAIFLFPALFAAIGQANATLFVAIFPLIGLLAAIFILPAIYGFEHD